MTLIDDPKDCGSVEGSNQVDDLVAIDSFRGNWLPDDRTAFSNCRPHKKRPATLDQFIICWGAFLLASFLVGALLLSLYRQSTAEQLRRASAAIAHGCDAITAQYQSFAGDATNASRDLRDPKLRGGLTRVIQIALHDLDGVEGGVWQTDRGSLAYAFPTYQGTGEKTDLPQAEESGISLASQKTRRASKLCD